MPVIILQSVFSLCVMCVSWFLYWCLFLICFIIWCTVVCGDVYVAMNGGFDGYISNLWYYNYSLGTAAIQRIVDNGPNLKMIGSNGVGDKMRDYLSLRWFFYGAGDSYNPSLK